MFASLLVMNLAFAIDVCQIATRSQNEPQAVGRWTPTRLASNTNPRL